MMRVLWILLLLLVAAGAWYLNQLRTAPPEVHYTHARKERLVSAVTTNGKVEPLEWTAVRSEREGTVLRLAVERGANLTPGALIAELDASDSKSDLSSAQARIAQAQAELDLLEKGGRARDIVEINASIEKLRIDIASAERQQQSLKRLVEKKAATPYEFEQLSERIELLRAEVRGLEARRGSLVSQQDKSAAQARIREAELAAATARRRIELSLIHAPLAGTLYQLEIRKGAYLRPGDLVGHIGRIDRVRVNVFVDEPELGNVRIGLPVNITWDALPGKQWAGTVEKLPTQIVALNSRQVGEVACIIDNSEKLLIPQTNVNAEIRTRVIESAMTIPKETLRRNNNESGVYVVQNGQVAWRKVTIGAASVTRLEVLEGLGEQDRIVLPTDLALKDGLVVKAVEGQ